MRYRVLSSATMGALVTMTALQDLTLDRCRHLLNDELFMLSALSALTSLSVKSCGTWSCPITC